MSSKLSRRSQEAAFILSVLGAIALVLALVISDGQDGTDQPLLFAAGLLLCLAGMILLLTSSLRRV